MIITQTTCVYIVSLYCTSVHIEKLPKKGLTVCTPVRWLLHIQLAYILCLYICTYLRYLWCLTWELLLSSHLTNDHIIYRISLTCNIIKCPVFSHAFKGTDFRDFVSSLVKPNKQLIRFKSCEMFESVFNKRFLLSVKQYITYVNAESDSGVCRIPWIKMSFI